MSEEAERYRRLAAQFTDRVRQVPVDAWDNPAPCEGWVARDVVRHLVEWIPGFFSGYGIDLEVGPSVDEDPVAAWEAVLGAKVSLTTLDGSVDLTIPAGSPTGQRLRLRGQGLARRDGSRGDLYARLKVVVPTHVNDTERELFQRLAAASDFRPR